MSICGYMNISAGVYGGQKEAGSLKLEFKAAVGQLTWYWEHGPATEQSMFPTAEPSLQPELILLAAYEFLKSIFFLNSEGTVSIFPQVFF